MTPRRIASQQCTQMPQNGVERPFWPICVHSCIPTVVRNGATVYTSAPKRRREAVFANLCTLLRPHPGSGSHAAEAVTQPPTRTHEASVRFAHLHCSGPRGRWLKPSRPNHERARQRLRPPDPSPMVYPEAAEFSRDFCQHVSSNFGDGV